LLCFILRISLQNLIKEINQLQEDNLEFSLDLKLLSVTGCHFTGPLALRPCLSTSLLLSVSFFEFVITSSYSQESSYINIVWKNNMEKQKNLTFGNWLPFYRPFSFASLPFGKFAIIG
jgi:hypothetical protein